MNAWQLSVFRVPVPAGTQPVGVFSAQSVGAQSVGSKRRPKVSASARVAVFGFAVSVNGTLRPADCVTGCERGTACVKTHF